METRNREPMPGPGEPGGGEVAGAQPGWPWKELINAARFWEPRRLLYNFLLTGVVLIWVVWSWPHFRPAMNLEGLGVAIVLGLLANVCYCAAYLAEILIQNATSSAAWNRQRWAIWVVGTLLAILFENYWIADEIYPFVK